MIAFLTFRKFAAPVLIQVNFWAGIATIAVSFLWWSIMSLMAYFSAILVNNPAGMHDNNSRLPAIAMLALALALLVLVHLIAVISWRVACEIAIVIFRCQEHLARLTTKQPSRLSWQPNAAPIRSNLKG
jgi:hypothetical protein